MQKMVKFDIWCPKCKYEKLDGNKEPCNTCLGYGAAEDSRKYDICNKEETKNEKKKNARTEFEKLKTKIQQELNLKTEGKNDGTKN